MYARACLCARKVWHLYACERVCILISWSMSWYEKVDVSQYVDVRARACACLSYDVNVCACTWSVANAKQSEWSKSVPVSVSACACKNIYSIIKASEQAWLCLHKADAWSTCATIVWSTTLVSSCFVFSVSLVFERNFICVHIYICPCWKSGKVGRGRKRKREKERRWLTTENSFLARFSVFALALPPHSSVGTSVIPNILILHPVKV